MHNNYIDSPKDRLLGRTVGDGWDVVRKLGEAEIVTGGQFSSGYIVEKDGRQAFLKAMDLTNALLCDPSHQLDRLRFFADMVEFEKLLLNVCKERRMSRVVRLLEEGTISPSVPMDPIQEAVQRVHFFIFELGFGDVRRTFGSPGNGDNDARLKMLHDLAIAIQQLHRSGIAHQDVKPSNILTFPDQEHKLADLGRASLQGRAGPSDQMPFPGDWNYAPPEIVYGYLAPEYNDRRFGTDTYLLGSMLTFMFTLQSATTLFQQAIPEKMLPPRWAPPGTAPWIGSFEDALPYLVQAHARICEYVAGYFPEFCRDELAKILFELTHPDPHLRGHPKSRREFGRLHGLDRYASAFDRLSKESCVCSRIEKGRNK